MLKKNPLTNECLTTKTKNQQISNKSKEKEKATIWDLIVTPPGFTGDNETVERNLFTGEVKRVLNFAALADNKDQIIYGSLRGICEDMCIDHHSLLEEEEKQYNK